MRVRPVAVFGGFVHSFGGWFLRQTKKKPGGSFLVVSVSNYQGNPFIVNQQDTSTLGNGSPNFRHAQLSG